jgi:hypothetical protein
LIFLLNVFNFVPDFLDSVAEKFEHLMLPLAELQDAEYLEQDNTDGTQFKVINTTPNESVLLRVAEEWKAEKRDMDSVIEYARLLLNDRT